MTSMQDIRRAGTASAAVLAGVCLFGTVGTGSALADTTGAAGTAEECVLGQVVQVVCDLLDLDGDDREGGTGSPSPSPRPPGDGEGTAAPKKPAGKDPGSAKSPRKKPATRTPSRSTGGTALGAAPSSVGSVTSAHLPPVLPPAPYTSQSRPELPDLTRNPQVASAPAVPVQARLAGNGTQVPPPWLVAGASALAGAVAAVNGTLLLGRVRRVRPHL